MKKMNKKGFTLAELLIVIAIIAILIAIAIPIFAAQLENARIQTDHANIRSAYAVAQTANIMGEIETGAAGSTTLVNTKTAGTLYFNKDGSLTTAATNAYECLGAGSADKCASSAGCQVSGVATHVAGAKITIVCDATTGAVTLKLVS